MYIPDIYMSISSVLETENILMSDFFIFFKSCM